MSADLDDELRRLFAEDPRLDVAARADADEVVLRGVRRSRRVRTALATAGGALAVVGVLLGGAFLAGFGRGEELPPAQTPSVTSESTPATTGSSAPVTSGAERTAPSPPSATGSTATSPASPPGTPWATSHSRVGGGSSVTGTPGSPGTSTASTGTETARSSVSGRPTPSAWTQIVESTASTR
ncbi:hypothetical protein LX15_004243 [Streptoalloteichus tenebrarius]|uniref:Uncharacterized protein n=1 Tax=Streptoalloteichus tenebrarius (strain ATCC 17920 / DSM 40477 / JCM 4838 / CBS 697.72 / NBRC 16177 / NCIMB 11028 / NRRL B-12390 / A12253. 1 / ISP 5477) TaxID=1933 RepID=A0ABT1HYT8_STRSD|nr:hypothetical protein [Streptoalloteichus tenebrarius]MCP2260525.1 hypothetical protein [Streptoalloteichus tenebrarius]BFF01865.1 hypothetical protein GCM10020241_35400 [Streptoalloteichus tenebrarius]